MASTVFKWWSGQSRPWARLPDWALAMLRARADDSLKRYLVDIDCTPFAIAQLFFLAFLMI